MSLDLIKECFKLQDSFNKKVNPNWASANYSWRRAAWIECAELCDWIGWKWWKKQESNIEQAKIEVVDIFHFIISDCIEKNYTPDHVLGAFNKASRMRNNIVTNDAILNQVEYLVESLLTGDNCLTAFFELVVMLGFEIEELCKLYIAKNVLNSFRQANGYKEGTYIKIWNGKEDNEVLQEIINSASAPSYEEIFNQLTLHYEGVKNEAQ